MATIKAHVRLDSFGIAGIFMARPQGCFEVLSLDLGQGDYGIIPGRAPAAGSNWAGMTALGLTPFPSCSHQSS